MNKTTTPARMAQALGQAIAAPAFAPVAPTPQADAHAGRGGLYEIVDGQRVLVERTDGQAQTAPAASAD